MIVKDLIEKLKEQDENKEVIIRFALTNKDDLGYILVPKIVDTYYEDEVAIYCNYETKKEDLDFFGQIDLKEAYEKMLEEDKQ